jgi:hypothetical protein
MYIGFQKSQTNLAQHLVHVPFTQDAALAQPLKDGLEFVGQILKHRAPIGSRSERGAIVMEKPCFVKFSGI